MLFKIVLFLVLAFTSMVLADYEESNDDSQQPEIRFDQQAARFLAFRVTKTSVVFTTSTSTSTVNPICAKLAPDLPACRRRRRGVEKPVIVSFDEDEEQTAFEPSPVQAIETTQVVSLNSAPISSGFDGLESSNEAPIEVDIIGLQNDCVGRRFGLVPALVSSAVSSVVSGVASVFPGVSGVSSAASSLASSLTSALNLTLRFTTTLTATATRVTTVTGAVTKTFSVAVCTPSPFLYTVCK
uniref:Uncharacterized protein n=1 Tax=Daphnia galeata TaxID=27404 RepID=A0A8J2RN57_9CRUS|nr:unnamed protein product [Daphnia galeata]